MKQRMAILIFLLAGSLAVLGNEPALPIGLGASSEPALPAGLGGSAVKEAAWDATSEPLVNLHGFTDVRFGTRLQSDAYEDESTLSEVRLQLSADQRWDLLAIQVVADFLYDDVRSSQDVDLQTGAGWVDLRQANAAVSPLSFLDLKIGRQILTWGTGDLLFINDNFPKDWQSFFSGRDEEYLKAPSDAVKASLFSEWANVDVVYTPQFDPDRYLTGERFSYYNSGLGRTAGQDAVVDAEVPDDSFDDDELAVRIFKTVSGYEIAAYVYKGFWKSPAGMTAGGKATFPELSVYGASVRGTVLGGIGNVEAGKMVSDGDRDGNDPMIRNSEWRVLAGYEKDLGIIASDFTAGVQYYVELMDDYDAYTAALPEGGAAKDEDRHVVTLRLTKMFANQTVVASIFTYYSPTDEDGYVRPSLSYKPSDDWMVFAGMNVFFGKDDSTFFGQFEDNSNAYAGARYSF